MSMCPYCGNSSDCYFTVYSRSYYRCLGCDLIYQSLPESHDQIVANYHENYFRKYSVDQMEGGRNTLFSHALDLIESRKERGRLLDVGTGCGFFLITAQERGWAVKGIEPSVQSVEVARRQNGLDIFHGTLREYREISRHDVISFINVLDHATIPWLEIDKAKKILRTGGLIYLRFPNGLLHSHIYRMAAKYGLAHLVRKFLVFHAYSFTPNYIKRLLDDYGFTNVTIINSSPSGGDPYGLFPGKFVATFVKGLIYAIAESTRILSGRKLLVGTSLEVTATKPT